MVSYQTWTSLLFEEAKKAGAQYSDISDGAETVEVAAAIWNERKNELKRATTAEARNIARQEITVS